MDKGQVKWIMLAIASPMIVLGLGQAVDHYSKNSAKRDIIVACYNAGNKDCNTLWNKEIK